MKLRHRSLIATGLALAALIAARPAIGQTPKYRFEPVIREGRTVRTYVFSLGQDSLGYMWIGSANGILRDDGMSIERLTAEGIGTEYAYFVDGSTGGGDVIVGTGAGLARIDREAMRIDPFLPLPDSQASWNDASTLMREGDTWWVGTFGGGLFRFEAGSPEPDQFHPVDGDSSTLGSWIVNDLVRLRDGSLWVATSDGLHRMRDDGRFDRYGPPWNRPGPESVLSLFEDEKTDGLLWLAEKTGLSTLDTRSGEYTPVLQYSKSDIYELGRIWWTLPQSMVRDPMDPDVLWLISEAEVIRHDRSSGDSERFTIRDSVTGQTHHPESIFVDRSGLVWIGTLEGLYTLDVSASDVHSVHAGDIAPDIQGVQLAAYDVEGHLWIVPQPRHGRILRIDPEFSRVEREIDLAGPLQILPGAEDRLFEWMLMGPGRTAWLSGWIITDMMDVAMRVDLDTEEVQRIAALDGDGFRWIFFEPSGPQLVITRRNELVSLDMERDIATPVAIEPGPTGESGSILDATRTADGSVWAATNQVIARVAPDGTVLERVRLQGPPGVQLFGPPNDPDVVYGRARNAIRKIHLTDGSVEDVYAGNIGTAVRSGDLLWFEDGDIQALDMDTDRVRRRYKSPPIRWLVPAPGGDVLVIHLPIGQEMNLLGAASESNSAPPVVVIQSVDVPGDTTGLHLPGPRELEQGATISLPDRTGGFGVSYIGIAHRDPRSVRYSYRLVGFDDEWVDAGSIRRATFPDLAPRTYTFEVRASETGGSWSSAPARLTVNVLPPWWRTPWAYVIYGIVALAIVVSWDRLQRRRVREDERRKAAMREAGIRAEAAEQDAVRSRIHLERMQELDETKNRLFANLSHEFRTPLTVLLGPLGEWSDHRDPGVLERGADAMHRNALRLLRLINQLLDLSRLEAGGLDLNPEPVDLGQFARATLDGFRPLAERRGVSLSLSSSEHGPVGMIDPDALDKVISNLVSNALKFTESGGKVDLSVVTLGDETTVTVRDTGIGIPADRLESVFDRFSQVDDSSTRSAEGTGIGLALVRELVELMGGSVSLESREGFGSTFTVRLPFEPADPAGPGEAAQAGVLARIEAAELASLSGTGDGESAGGGEGPLVLVVDDNPDIRDYVGRHLESDHRVIPVADGASALKIAREQRPELVIADVMMPGMDGFELCRAIRADASLRHVPVILLTARAEEEDRIRGLEEGADDYLTKPFSVRELEVRVTNLILSRRSLREVFARTVRVTADPVENDPDDFADRVLEMMNRHLGDSAFGTDMLASEVGLSRRQVERRVQESLGRSPSDLLREMRLERAAQILKARPGSIAEVARAVGYRSAPHFSVAFRKAYGMTPTEYFDSAT